MNNQKTVMITGGAGGIGQACVQRFLEKGEKVIIVDYNQEMIDQCVQQFSHLGDVYGYAIDLSHSENISEFVSYILQTHQQIDVLVQAAGLMASQPAIDIQVSDFERLLKVNVEGLFFMMQEVVKQSMMKTGGCILNFASEAAIRGFTGPMAGVHYSASKGAVIAMSRQLAVEWGEYHIRVNSICPGGVLTPAMEKMGFDEEMNTIPLKRLSRPRDIANSVAYLCSDEASMITGQNIVVDGGCAAVGC